MELVYVPPETVDSILAKTDILSVVSQRVSLKKTGNNYTACCPFHDEKTASFSVSDSKQFYFCFGCGAGGSALNFVMEYDGLSFVEAVDQLAKNAGVDLSHLELKRDDETLALNRLSVQIAEHYQSLLPEAKVANTYLAQRGISNDTQQRFAIGASKDSWHDVLKRFGRDPKIKAQLSELGLIKRNDDDQEYDTFRNRLMFPIRSPSGQVLGFGARTISDEAPKYLNSSESALFQKRETLYGLYENKTAIRQQNEALLVEGYMDVVGLSEQGIGNAVASLGTAITDKQLKRLAQYTERFVFCLDGDRAGHKAAEKALETLLPLLKDSYQVSFVFFPDNHDPDSYSKEHGQVAFQKLVSQAVPLSRFLLNTLHGDSTSDDVESRLLLAREAGRYLNKIKQASGFKTLVTNELAAMLNMDPNALGDMAENHTDPVRSQHKQVKPVTMTPVRKAIATVLQYPEIVRHGQAPYSHLDKLDNRGVTLLRELLQIVQAVPVSAPITSAQIVERCRDKEGEVLNSIMKLAGLTIESPEILEKEWPVIMANLEQEGKQAYIQTLASKPFETFTSEDKASFKALF